VSSKFLCILLQFLEFSPILELIFYVISFIICIFHFDFYAVDFCFIFWFPFVYLKIIIIKIENILWVLALHDWLG